MHEGTVKWFNADGGYGYITYGGGPDVYVTFDALGGQTARHLEPGQRVAFEVEPARNGHPPRARNVKPL